MAYETSPLHTVVHCLALCNIWSNRQSNLQKMKASGVKLWCKEIFSLLIYDPHDNQRCFWKKVISVYFVGNIGDRVYLESIIVII